MRVGGKDRSKKAPAFLKRETPNNRLRVKEMNLPLATSKILGSGIDVTTLPEGHMSCNNCSGYKFEAHMYLDNYRLECGCMSCGNSFRLLFPLDCPLPEISGRFSCFRHPHKGMIIIHNSGSLCIGCECCKSQIIFEIRTKQNILLPGDLN